MFSYSFISAWRNLLKHKTYTIINISGLAIGLASFIVILLYLNYELSYDKWDPSLERVAKISLWENGDINTTTPAPLASYLLNKYSRAEAATACRPSRDFEVLLSNGEKKIYQKAVVSADSLFLKVFPYKLTAGNPSTALDAPDAIILSEQVSKKLFGNENPLGKPVKVYSATDAVVTGVFKQPEGPSHLDAQVIMRDRFERQNKFWTNYSYQTYIKTKQPLPAAQLENDINRLYYNERLKKDNLSFEDYRKASHRTELFVDQVQRIRNFPKYGTGHFTGAAVLLLLAVLLLVAGAINFSNFAMARTISRAKEAGMRKVLGAGHKQLIFHFMWETALQCIISLILAILLVAFALPYFNRSFDLPLSLLQQGAGLSIAGQILLCLVVITLLSGLYPAVLLSRFNPTRVLKGDYNSGKKGLLFRNGLIVLQFVVASCFITGTLVINKQMHFMQQKDKGFSGSQVIRIEVTQKTREEGFDAARNALLAIKDVQYVSKTTVVPGDKMLDTATFAFRYAGQEHRMMSVKVSADYFHTLNIPLQRGRLFSTGYADVNTRTAIINETAARKLGISDPAGKRLSFPGCDSIQCEMIGIVKDFNVQGFERTVQPVVYTIGNKACMYQSGGAILVKLSSPQLQGSVAAVEKAWKKIEPDFPIQYSFLDDNFQRLFLSYVRLQKIVAFFALVAILISVTGLFALTAFLSGRRTKEVGIRKVLGASIGNLTALLSKDLIRLVIIAVIIATPCAWWAVNKWLENLAYHINPSWLLFFTAAVITTVIALATVTAQTIKAALVNPAKSLRSE